MINQDTIYIDGKQFRPPQKCEGSLSVSEFPALIGDTLAKAWMGTRYQFSEEYPDTSKVIIPSIVWHVYNRTPGDGRNTQYKPQQVEFRKLAHNDGLQIWMQPWLVVYQFDCIGSTAREATELSQNFESFMFEMTPLFINKGVNKLFFTEQLVDHMANRNNERLNVRSLRYTALLQTILPRRVGLTERVNLELLGEIDKAYYEPVLRAASGHSDILAYPIYSITTISSGADSAEVYVQEIDYHTVEVEGKSYIYWNEHGKNPAVGSTYYVTYYYYVRNKNLQVINE